MNRQSSLVAALIAMALGTLSARPSRPPVPKTSRAPADIVRRKAKQAAKRARRAARAGHKVGE
ncbi:hypothetical protein [Rhodanobacter lindaniclasticus]